MAVNAYLHIEGVDGPSTNSPGNIDILSFSWGVAQTSTYGAGSSGKESKAGRADFANLSIMKVTDKTSPLLMDHCASGDILKNVYIIYQKPVGDKQQAYFRIYLADALITGVHLSGSNENPTEQVSFAYQSVEVAYAPEKDDGSLDAAVRKGFDLATVKDNYAAPDGLPS